MLLKNEKIFLHLTMKKPVVSSSCNYLLLSIVPLKNKKYFNVATNINSQKNC